MTEETFIKYLQKTPVLNDEEHKKAWLIKVCINCCKDMLRYKNNHQTFSMDEIKELSEDLDSDDSEVLEMIFFTS